MKYGKIQYMLLLLCALAAVVAFLPANALADKASHVLKGISPKADTVDIMLGKAEMVMLKSNVSDVLVANPGIVDVMAVKANQLYLVGNALGDTNIMALDEDGNVVRRINVHVQMDTERLEAMIKLLYPTETVNVSALTDQLVLTGHVSTPAVSNSIATLVAQYAAEARGARGGTVDEVIANMLTVAGEQQVMLKVRILEASRSALKDWGSETSFDGEVGNVGTALTAATMGLSSPVQLGVLALNYTSGSFGPMNFLARALEEEGILNTLAEPNLTAISGEQAGFLAGGEIPIPTELDRNGNLVYEFRPFGVSLNFRPKVMSPNRISLQMSTEVSSASFSDNLQLQGINVPTFNVRRADTTVELPSGGTLMIAGLLQSDAVSSLTSIPGVNKIPVVGDLLKSDTFQRNESELLVMITPYLVRPFADNQAAPMAQQTSSNTPADLNAIPRLSMKDLGEMDSEDHAAFAAQAPDRAPVPERKPKQAMAMAPPSGLSEDSILGLTPNEDRLVAHPNRENNALSKVFESNIRRTYGSRAVDNVMKDIGSFGYITD